MKKSIITRKFETIIVTFMVVLFLFGFFLGWKISDTTLNETEYEIEKLSLDLRSLSQQIQFDNTFEFVCDESRVDLFLNGLSRIAYKLDELEKKGLVNDDFYKILKEKHNNNQVLFYVYYNNYMERCIDSKGIILFFFDSSNVEKSVEQGRILDEIVLEEEIIILPMDYGNSSSLIYFYEYFQFDELPSLVINYNETFSGVSSKERILEAIN